MRTSRDVVGFESGILGRFVTSTGSKEAIVSGVGEEMIEGGTGKFGESGACIIEVEVGRKGLGSKIHPAPI